MLILMTVPSSFYFVGLQSRLEVELQQMLPFKSTFQVNNDIFIFTLPFLFIPPPFYGSLCFPLIVLSFRYL